MVHVCVRERRVCVRAANFISCRLSARTHTHPPKCRREEEEEAVAEKAAAVKGAKWDSYYMAGGEAGG
jgi:hypothetical protein